MKNCKQTSAQSNTLLLETKRTGYTLNDLCKLAGVSVVSLRHKLRGETDWRLWEMKSIKKVLKSKMPIEELFAEGVLCASAEKKEE